MLSPARQIYLHTVKCTSIYSFDNVRSPVTTITIKISNSSCYLVLLLCTHLSLTHPNLSFYTFAFSKVTYKRNQIICRLSSLTSFTQNGALKIHLHCCLYQQLLFHCQVPQYSTVWLHLGLLIHSPFEGYLGYFQFGAVTKKAFIVIHIQAFV